MWNEALAALRGSSCQAGSDSCQDMRSSAAHHAYSCYVRALVVSRLNHTDQAQTVMLRARGEE